MTVFDSLLLVWAIAACAWLVAAVIRIVVNARAFRLLERQSPPTPPRWPKLSVIIPACNESDTLEGAITTLLGQDYPDMEVVLVNDRSTDGTAQIVDALARRDKRVVPLHIAELPTGWLGKNHALYQAEKHVSGEFILFTDADVHYAPGALRRAVAFCVAEDKDHLTVVPDSPRERPMPLSVRAAITGYLYQLFWMVPIAGIERTGKNPFFGLGAFNLVRADALRKSDGLSWLRMEVSDDFGIALLVHRIGGKSAVLGGRGQVSIVWWPTFRAMLRSKDKDFSDYAFSYTKILGWAMALWALIAGPAIFMQFGLGELGAVVYGLVLVTGIWITRLAGYSANGAMLFPLSAAVLACNLAHSAWTAWRRGGLMWRDTRYSLDELRELQRVRYDE